MITNRFLAYPTFTIACLISFTACKIKQTPVTPPPAPPAAQADPIAAAQEQVKKAPSYENYLTLGLAYSKAGKHSEELDAYERAVAINPKAPIAHNNLCAARNSMKHWAIAIRHCEQALALQPGFELAKNNLEYAKKSKAAEEARISTLQKNILAGQNIDDNRLALGMELYQQMDYEEAAATWKLISEKSKLFGLAQNNVASAYILLKKFDLAKKAVDNAIRIEPNNTLFQNNLRWLKQAEAAAKDQ